MSRGIFLIQSNGQLVEMKEAAYDSESLLQSYLADYPDLLAGDQMNQKDPRKWLLITQEASLPSEEGGGGRWALDHLFLDQDAIPTIVEVKRSSDSRIRREVVGQMLDYAANAVVYWPIESLRSQFERHCEKRGIEAEQVLSDFLGPEADSEGFWQKAKTNLQAGKVRLLFAADEIPVELRRIVEFLNEQMDPAEVLAVEIKQYAGEGLTTLVPNVIGQTAEAQQRKSGTARAQRQWDESSFFQEMEERRSAEETNAARRIYEWAQKRTTGIWWGKGLQTGSFVPTLDSPDGIQHLLFAIFSDGKVQIYFKAYQNRPGFESEEKRFELLNRLNAISGVSISEDAITKYPSISLSVLSRDQNLGQFLEVFEWFLQVVTS